MPIKFLLTAIGNARHITVVGNAMSKMAAAICSVARLEAYCLYWYFYARWPDLK